MGLFPFMEAIFFFKKIEAGDGRHLRQSHLNQNADPEYFSQMPQTLFMNLYFVNFLISWLFLGLFSI